jgi:hypothetical protein
MTSKRQREEGALECTKCKEVLQWGGIQQPFFELVASPDKQHEDDETHRVCVRCFGGLQADRGCSPHFDCPSEGCSSRVVGHSRGRGGGGNGDGEFENVKYNNNNNKIIIIIIGRRTILCRVLHKRRRTRPEWVACGEGIYAYFFNIETGRLSAGPVLSGMVVTNPTYLHFDDRKGLLYAIEETTEDAGGSDRRHRRPACLVSFHVNHEDGGLREQSHVETPLVAGCHLTVVGGDKVMVAAYVLGDILCNRINPEDGSLIIQKSSCC